jgi:prepilin-type N-terminal cleavage/methylation domain-containing protein
LRSGFTLVELLVVIAIIGVLVGITVPAVQAVRSSFERSANKFEAQSLNDAVEKYRSIYGDYPPDGSSAAIMQRHLRKAFPNILQSEIDLLNGVQLDPAEALVFFLGGFSSDKQRPITGKGGPIVNTGTTASPVYNYNVARENSMHEFVSGRLVLDDEFVFANSANDPFPVYMARNNPSSVGCPYVYFDSRTYTANRGTVANPIYNCYQPSDIVTTTANMPRGKLGAVRPYLKSVTGPNNFAFENSKTFQIIGPGSDGLFGGRILALSSPTDTHYFNSRGLSYSFNGTQMILDTTTTVPFKLLENANLAVQPGYDNVCNFTDTATLGENSVAN